jgi:uncharacterized repeat protein (TIGR03847 family)
MSESFDLRDVNHCTVGSVGEPGQRAFFIQAGETGQLVALRLEKQQVSALAQYLRQALEDLPELAETEVIASGELIEPVVAEWVVGALGVAYDDTAEAFVIAAEELVDPDDPTAEGARARFHLTRPRVAGFVTRADSAARGGRPPCPICGGPMDPAGHVCPRSNGHGTH